MNVRISDEDLMDRVKKNERSAYEVLYVRWKAPLFSFLLRRTCRRSYAEDALQETWGRVYKYRRSYTEGRPFRPWLYRIAANAGRDAYKPEPALLPLKPELIPDGYHHYEVTALRDQLVYALHQLPSRDRRLLLLIGEGFTSAEVAEIMHIPASTIRTRLARARSSIREALDE